MSGLIIMRVLFRLCEEIKEHIFHVVRISLKGHFAFCHIILRVETFSIKIFLYHFHLIFLHLLIIFVIFGEIWLFGSLPICEFFHLLELRFKISIKLSKLHEIIGEVFDILISLLNFYNSWCFIDSNPLFSSLYHHIRPLMIVIIYSLLFELD